MESTAKVSRWTRHEAGSSDQWIPRSMRLDVPKFNGSDPDTWILAINEYFSLLETTPEQQQRLRIIGFIMEGDATDLVLLNCVESKFKKKLCVNQDASSNIPSTSMMAIAHIPFETYTYLENQKREHSSVEAENANLSDEVENLMNGYLEDSIRLQSNLEGLTFFLEFIPGSSYNFDLATKKADARLKCSSMVEQQPYSDGALGVCKFKILELNSLIEKKHDILKTLENLDYTFRRLSIEHKDRDEMIVAHMVDGVDAFIKIPQGWPIANFALKVNLQRRLLLALFAKLRLVIHV
ncbi:hypothetical protein Tco_0738521 [Tanacetum coccineum]